MKAICLGCGQETETPWQCACGWRRTPTQEDVDLLQRNLTERLGIAREQRRRVAERERRHQLAERARAEWRQKEQEAEEKEWRARTERIKANQRETRRQEAERILGEWLAEWRREEAQRAEAERIKAEAEREAQRIEAEQRRQEAASRAEAFREKRAAKRARKAQREQARPKTEPQPDLYAAEPISPLMEWTNYRRAVTALNLGSEARFFEQRTEAAHQHFEKVAAELAQSLPEPRFDLFDELRRAHWKRRHAPYRG